MKYHELSHLEFTTENMMTEMRWPLDQLEEVQAQWQTLGKFNLLIN